MKRPWNIIDCQVYSLETYQENTVNMNICTYVTAVSMKPKIYAIAVYHGSKTLENVQKSDTAVLQILTKDQASLVNYLGKKSGKDVQKERYVERKKMLTQEHGKKVLAGCAAYVFVKKVKSLPMGDHDVYFYEVEKYIGKSEENLLTFQYLKQQKIIR